MFLGQNIRWDERYTEVNKTFDNFKSALCDSRDAQKEHTLVCGFEHTFDNL